MTSLRSEVVAHINLANLKHNFRYAKSLAPHSKIMAVVKADAYGHGQREVCHALEDADAFGVARVHEAVDLRNAGIDKPIVILGGFVSKDELQTVLDLKLQTVIQSPFQVDFIDLLGKRVDVWIKIDTGMGRLGFSQAQFEELMDKKSSLINICSLMSHFACADDPKNNLSAAQMARFSEWTSGYDYPASLANSAAIMAIAESHLDWVRAGIMLYGLSPFHGSKAHPDLKPVMTLKAPLISVKPIKKGQTVGYGATFTCERDSLIGIVAIGYGDGYPREMSSGTPVLAGDKKAVLAGRVSMDLAAIDLTDAGPVKEGTEVVLWGHGLPAEEVASPVGTIPYTLTARLTNRVVRQYTDPGN